MKRIFICGDRQIPFDDKKARSLVLRFLQAIKPDEYIENGDLLDLGLISKYCQIPGKAKDSVQYQLEEGGKVFAEIRKVLPKAKIRYIIGNHDFRLRSYIINRAPELYGLHGIVFRKLLKLDELDIELIDAPEEAAKWNGVWYQIPKTNVYVGHYNRVAKHSAFTVKALIEDMGVSVIQNHTHRGGVYYKSFLDGKELFGIENFSLCERKQPYSSFNNWQLGLTVLNIEGSWVYPEPIWIQDYKIFYRGKLYI